MGTNENSTADGVLFPDVTVQLTGQDGNAVMILGLVSKALKRAGHSDAVAAFTDEATAGDYHHLVRTAMRYVEVELCL